MVTYTKEEYRFLARLQSLERRVDRLAKVELYRYVANHLRYSAVVYDKVADGIASRA